MRSLSLLNPYVESVTVEPHPKDLHDFPTPNTPSPVLFLIYGTDMSKALLLP